MQALLPAFSLRDQHGADRAFPTGRVALIAIVKEDCPTCQLVMPLLATFQQRYGDGVDVLIIGQTTDGNAALCERYQLTATTRS